MLRLSNWGVSFFGRIQIEQRRENCAFRTVQESEICELKSGHFQKEFVGQWSTLFCREVFVRVAVGGDRCEPVFISHISDVLENMYLD